MATLVGAAMGYVFGIELAATAVFLGLYVGITSLCPCFESPPDWKTVTADILKEELQDEKAVLRGSATKEEAASPTRP